MRMRINFDKKKINIKQSVTYINYYKPSDCIIFRGNEAFYQVSYLCSISSSINFFFQSASFSERLHQGMFAYPKNISFFFKYGTFIWIECIFWFLLIRDILIPKTSYDSSTFKNKCYCVPNWRSDILRTDSPTVTTHFELNKKDWDILIS